MTSSVAASRGVLRVVPAALHPPGASLGDRFDSRRNHVTLMRLGLAVAVAVVHAFELGFGHQPAIGHTKVGDLAVDAFFVLSGFLITASFLRLGSVGRYVWHRFLRIMPAFWICLVLTAAVVAPAVAAIQGRSPLSVFTAPQDSAVDYLVANAALLMRQFGIAGLPVDVPVPDVMDGSLWTLFYEALCYLGVIGLGVLGALRRRPVLTLLTTALVWVVVASQAIDTPLVDQERMPRFTLLFLIGAAAWLYAGRIPVRGLLAAASLALLAASLLGLDDYVVVGGPALAYVLLWIAVWRPPARPLRHDLSYGLYIYHWPVEQVFVVAGLAAWGQAPFVAISLTAAGAAAATSWWLVERPALGLKNATWTRRRNPARTGQPAHTSNTGTNPATPPALADHPAPGR